MTPNSTFRNVLRLCLIALAVVTAFVAAAYRTPLAVSLGASLFIAAIAASPREVLAYTLIVFAAAIECLSDSCYNLRRFCVTCARRLDPSLLSQFEFTGPCTDPLHAELRVGDRSVFLSAENFRISSGLLSEIARSIFARCSEFDEGGTHTNTASAFTGDPVETNIAEDEPPVAVPFHVAEAATDVHTQSCCTAKQSREHHVLAG